MSDGKTVTIKETLPSSIEEPGDSEVRQTVRDTGFEILFGKWLCAQLTPIVHERNATTIYTFTLPSSIFDAPVSEIVCFNKNVAYSTNWAAWTYSVPAAMCVWVTDTSQRTTEIISSAVATMINCSGAQVPNEVRATISLPGGCEYSLAVGVPLANIVSGSWTVMLKIG